MTTAVTAFSRHLHASRHPPVHKLAPCRTRCRESGSYQYQDLLALLVLVESKVYRGFKESVLWALRDYVVKEEIEARKVKEESQELAQLVLLALLDPAVNRDYKEFHHSSTSPMVH
jgi:hypothetical protein